MKNAIIVGATSGIGLEVARIMRSEGVNIGVAGRREDRLRKFAEEGGNVVWQRIDVTDENAGELLVDLAERMGGVDTILLDAGVDKLTIALIFDKIRYKGLGTSENM